MDIDVEALKVKHNVAENRFEVALGDTIGELTYRKDGPVYILEHTGIPDEFSGRGIATHLVHDTLEQISAENGKIVAVCSFVRSYLRQHPEYEPLVAHIPRA